MSDTRNIKLGTCKVMFDGNDLGFTIGGVELTVTTNTHETKVDQFGDTVVNDRIMGRNIMVKVPLAETTLENLVTIMPGAELVGTVDKKKVVVKTGTGLSLLDFAKELVLHPVALPDSDKSEDVVIHKAGTAGAMSYAYKVDEERVFPVEFKGYPDSVTGALFTVGDPTAANGS